MKLNIYSISNILALPEMLRKEKFGNVSAALSCLSRTVDSVHFVYERECHVDNAVTLLFRIENIFVIPFSIFESEWKVNCLFRTSHRCFSCCCSKNNK